MNLWCKYNLHKYRDNSGPIYSILLTLLLFGSSATVPGGVNNGDELECSTYVPQLCPCHNLFTIISCFIEVMTMFLCNHHPTLHADRKEPGLQTIK
jgi:hypothetical protein